MANNWKKKIYEHANDHVEPIVRQMREDYPELRVQLNYVIVFPKEFSDNITSLPVVVQTNKGNLYLGDLIVNIDKDTTGSFNLSIKKFTIKSPVEEYDGEIHQPKAEKTLTTVFDTLNDFFAEINKSVLFSDSMDRILTPRMPLLDDRRLPIQTIQSVKSSTSIPIQRSLSTVRGILKRREEDPSELAKIVSDDDRKRYIITIIDSSGAAPTWYAVLGEHAKSEMRQKITKWYLDSCKSQGRTLNGVQYINSLTRQLLKNNILVHYCEGGNGVINGTVGDSALEGPYCMERNCVKYSKGCEKLSQRLNLGAKNATG